LPQLEHRIGSEAPSEREARSDRLIDRAVLG
jgi:hypothetical protein